MDEQYKKYPWYLRKEIWGAAGTVVSAVLSSADPGSFWYLLSGAVSVLLSAWGLTKGEQYRNQPWHRQKEQL